MIGVSNGGRGWGGLEVVMQRWEGWTKWMECDEVSCECFSLTSSTMSK